MTLKSAVITGAGSGVGQAVAVQLAKDGWQVALVGRREAALSETVQMAGDAKEHFLLCPCDIGDAAAVQAMATQILSVFGSVQVLVNAAGTNAPRRSLELTSLEDYQRIIDTNLNGAYYCVQAFLPGMRQQGAGTIVNIDSMAGLQASALSGVAYSMSKFGMRGLNQAINAEERQHGIRACCIFPGDINTPLLDRRPNPPPSEARQHMLQSEDVAACTLLAINLPARAIVAELVIHPR